MVITRERWSGKWSKYNVDILECKGCVREMGLIKGEVFFLESIQKEEGKSVKLVWGIENR